LLAGAQFLGIPLLDHLILGDGNHQSLREIDFVGGISKETSLKNLHSLSFQVLALLQSNFVLCRFKLYTV